MSTPSRTILFRASRVLLTAVLAACASGSGDSAPQAADLSSAADAGETEDAVETIAPQVEAGGDSLVVANRQSVNWTYRVSRLGSWALLDGTLVLEGRPGNAEGSGLVALEARTGTQRWFLPFPGGGEDRLAATPVAASGRIFAVTGGEGGSDAAAGRLHAIEAGTGAVAWTVPGVLFRPAAGDGVVCYTLAADRALHCRDAGTTPVIGTDWRFAAAGTARAAARADSTVYVGDDSGHVYAVRLATKAKAWEAPRLLAASGEPAVISRIIVERGVAYVLARKKGVVALDAATGAVRWERADDALFALRGASPEYVYVYGDGALHALRVSDGSVAWSFRFRGSYDSADEFVALARITQNPPVPAEDGRTVYVGTASHVVALDRATGQETWRRDVGRSTMAQVADGVLFSTAYSEAGGYEVRGTGTAIFEAQVRQDEMQRDAAAAMNDAERERCRPVLQEIAGARMTNDKAMQRAMRDGCEAFLIR